MPLFMQNMKIEYVHTKTDTNERYVLDDGPFIKKITLSA